MSENNHGGKREGAGSGGKREGAGRPRTKLTLKPGEIYIMELSNIDGFPAKPKQWRVLGIDSNGTIEFQDIETEQIISIIPQDEYE